MFCRGPLGYIYHGPPSKNSKFKWVHPKGGSFCPDNDTQLMIHESKGHQMQFILVDRINRYGYIEHVSSGKIVHPKGGGANPRKDTALVFHSDRHDGALFRFDEGNCRIVHKGGKMIWHPKGGSLEPSNGTTCVLHSDIHNGAKFYFGDSSGKPISPYPEKPKLSGEWKLVTEITAPKELSRTVEYSTGVSAESVGAKRISKGDVYECLGTRSQERKEYLTMKLKEGDTVAIWQYVISITQNDNKWFFKTNVIEETLSLAIIPQQVDFVCDPNDWIQNLSVDIPNLLDQLQCITPRRSMSRQSSSTSLGPVQEMPSASLSCKKDVLFIGSFGDKIPEDVKVLQKRDVSSSVKGGVYLSRIEEDLMRIRGYCKKDPLLALQRENICKDRPGNQHPKEYYLEKIVSFLKNCAGDKVGGKISKYCIPLSPSMSIIMLLDPVCEELKEGNPYYRKTIKLCT